MYGTTDPIQSILLDPTHILRFFLNLPLHLLLRFDNLLFAAPPYTTLKQS